MTGTDGIGLIKEVSTCNYILLINTPRLCNVPGFSSTHLSEPPSGISCREIVPDGSLPTPKIDPDSAAETESSRTSSKDRTPLPSWAILPAAAAARPPLPKNPLLSPKQQQQQQQLTPKPLNVAETFETILQRALAKLDLAAGATAEGGEEEEEIPVGEGDAAVVTLRVSHDPETGEIRFLNEDGSPFDPSAIDDDDDGTEMDADEQHQHERETLTTSLLVAAQP
ncbi:hypothetical protein BDY24DRAFT_77400 [Mrakia frigida]|uniref:uncharacterized protein n=1 Tax=Mrakia frigida TaxID=29902 RepID=UPI003FCBEF4A